MSTITPAPGVAVSGAFATTPAYSGTFIPAIWSGKLIANFYAASTFADVCNRDYEGEISKMGDKVVINTTPALTINNYVVGTNLTYGVPTPGSIELNIDRLSQERDVHLRQRVSLFVQRNQLVGEMAVLQAVVEVQLARLEALPDLAVQPELVAVSVQAGRLAVGVEG